MFYLDTGDQLSLLITLCFSFFIFMNSLLFKKSDTFSRLFGLSFFTPFILSVFSFISNKKTFSDMLSLMSELMVLILLLLLATFKPAKGNFRFFYTMLLLLPFILLMAINSISALSVDINKPSVWILSYMLLCITVMFILKREHNHRGILFWPPIPLALIPLARFLTPWDSAGYITAILKLAAYIGIYYYFCKSYFEDLYSTVTEAHEKIRMADRQLEREVKKRVFEIEQVNRNLVVKAKTDAMTNSLSKTGIIEEIDRLAAAKGNNVFSIIMFDLDNFKKINDTLGHMEGDKCLKKLSAIARSNIRETDFLGRYGGDEFIIVLPGTNLNHTMQITEHLRKRIETTETPHFTISSGVASFPNDGKTSKELIKAADEGLYYSKEKGRNAVSYRRNY